MIAIIGHIDVDPAQRDGLVASTVELQRATASDEPGCLVYTIAADPANPGRISIVELWESAETLDAHFQHPNFFATGDALRAGTRLGGSGDEVPDRRRVAGARAGRHRHRRLRDERRLSGAPP